MKAFITGATGFLGTNLIFLLLKQGVEVHAIRRTTSDISAFKDCSINWYEGDVLNFDSLNSACPQDVDTIFHIAADTSMWSQKNELQSKINLGGTENIIQLALTRENCRLVHTSSIAAFGIHHNETITEETPQRGGDSIANYYRTKYLSEQNIRKAVKEQDLDAVILNPCHLVGPWDTHNWSQMFTLIATDKLPGVPPGFGSFCHIEQVAHAHWQAALKGRKGENYILSGADASFVEFAQKIGGLLNKKVPEKPIPAWLLTIIGQVSEWWAFISKKEPDVTPEKALIVSDVLKVSSAKAQKELGYNASVPLDDMLQDCFDWLRQHKRI
ncbi:NAD-dependent epimerase/dehydratase family protein [Pleionea sp. CnH1-48]|uniref:SDR family oxidoreductase n=1 Tax=Pleionea sp. CnH1-48 TaxID=2954494 RepID=UPI002097F128|nr:SDR family oxidoreductase [Pleionea sp. CnH1-48]